MSQTFSSNRIATGDPRDDRRPRLMFDFEEVFKKTSKQTVTCISELLLDDLVYGETSRGSPDPAGANSSRTWSVAVDRGNTIVIDCMPGLGGSSASIDLSRRDTELQPMSWCGRDRGGEAAVNLKRRAGIGRGSR